jgi:Ca2+-binding RTX toxin-like protein
VSFAAGETSKVITVNVQGDSTVEPDENFTVTLSNASNGATLTTATAIGTITNDDTALAIAATNAVQTEGNSGTKAFTFTVTRSGFITGTNEVNWAVTGSGTNPADASDFSGNVLPSGIVSFAAGETSKVITVNVQGDSTVEPDENFTVTLSNASNGANITTATAIGTITNDDSLPTLPTITLEVNPSSVVEDGTTNLTYTFTRTGDLTNSLSVNYSIGGTASNGTDYGNIGTSVSFAANSNTATVIVDPTADNVVEPDETVSLTLTSDPSYVLGTIAPVTGTITNDDSLPIANTDGIFDVTQNTPLTLTVSQLLSNDVDVDGDVLSIIAVSNPLNGIVTLMGNNIIFTPNPTYLGVASFEYTLSDSNNGTDTGLVNLKVNPFQGGTGSEILVGSDLDDILIGGQGRDILTGKGGVDTFTYNSITEGGDTITDFTVGEDKIDFCGLLRVLGYTGSNPITDQYIRFSGVGSSPDSFIRIDPDGIGSARARSFILVQNVSVSDLNNLDNFVF